MPSDERKELLENLKVLKKEISDLRLNLNSLNEQKEIWFKKREEFTPKLSSLINNLKGIKSEKDSFNKNFQKEKEKRDRFNKEVKGLALNLRNLKQEKSDFLKKHNIKSDPEKIKQIMENLESSIETEAFSFAKEKKIMSEIKRLRALYSETSQVNTIVEQISLVSKQLDEKRKLADEAHNRLKSFRSKNKEGYDSFINLSRNINLLKKQREDAFRNFLDFKKQFVQINNSLKEKLGSLKRIQVSLDAFKKKSSAKKRIKEDLLLQEKTKFVEEKLKSGKKLTTEDLVVFQKKK